MHLKTGTKKNMEEFKTLKFVFITTPLKSFINILT